MCCPCVCVQNGATPLFIAAQNGHVPCMELLLGKGAKVDLATKVGEGQQGLGAPLPTATPSEHQPCMPQRVRLTPANAG
jgi:ankyrin repeat protein